MRHTNNSMATSIPPASVVVKQEPQSRPKNQAHGNPAPAPVVVKQEPRAQNPVNDRLAPPEKSRAKAPDNSTAGNLIHYHLLTGKFNLIF
jgi:hypothetical protein